MDNLTRWLVGKYGSVLHIRSEISPQAVHNARNHIDLEDHIKRSMSVELAHKLLNSKAAAFSELRVPGENIVFAAKLIALTDEEITSIVNAAYDAGLESKETLYERAP